MGVYKIENIKNHKRYIGSSKNIEIRWKQHLAELENNTHHSIKLQRCYNKLKDKNSLAFSIIEVVDNIDILRTREQYYIDFYDSYNNGYNCSEKVENPRYALKNQKKSQNNKKVKSYFKEFQNLYDPNIFRFPPKILARIESKKYKSDGFKKIILFMRLFLKYFSKCPFWCKIYFDQKKIFMEIYANKNDYIRYHLHKDGAFGDFPVTSSDIKMMKHRTDYSHLLHGVFKRFQILTLK